ncbi:AraC family transcriptional regulator [Fulvivirga sp. M361]|uniref:helix-turn-helix domain-containing protein n=1 Tax=Fulvivirga sp. M361 TaxID=2594266 RepID=UPI001179E317|nr:helix-turn-helix domain-containing protein [Fulvivirga sp. M361]TRX59205.1 AraC family transcriptional regulator [Fulvivirga sp. M361]
MKYLTLPPPVSLAEYVRFFWILESGQSYEHRSLADGSVEMIFHYQGSFDEIKSDSPRACPPSAIQGTSSDYQVYTCQSAFGIFGIYFYPYAVPALFDIPANELSNEMPDLHAFLGVEGKDLEDQMITSQNNADRISIISAFLERRVKQIEKRDAGMHHLICSIIHNGCKTNIELTAKEFSLSRRQFERRFKMLAGFSPKMYERIIRFQNAADEYNKQQKSLTQIALEFGYYDHSHFTNEFKKFSGYNPKGYFSGNEVGYEWRNADAEMSQNSKN